MRECNIQQQQFSLTRSYERENLLNRLFVSLSVSPFICLVHAARTTDYLLRTHTQPTDRSSPITGGRARISIRDTLCYEIVSHRNSFCTLYQFKEKRASSLFLARLLASRWLVFSLMQFEQNMKRKTKKPAVSLTE